MNVKPQYYYDGTTRVMMRTDSSTLNYLLGDHSLATARDRLGSMTVAADSSGTKSAEQLYTAWGTARPQNTKPWQAETAAPPLLELPRYELEISFALSRGEASEACFALTRISRVDELSWMLKVFAGQFPNIK